MATTSFDRNFVVSDSKSIEQIHKDLEAPRHVKIKKRNYKADSVKGIALLKQQLLNLEACQGLGG
ncbi:hypothetical protein WH43_00060 [Rheinheimera sp. KL1]|uniref:hypothetical protein n=1 Tax=Rheinheimera sp. KL1 TaxID=1635005 RepID=UPI0006A953DF|nr:hypothetical protein [Rheinheimera sp. KL1]KOO60059.1 hypothetical protein WH43_00060 [Rheinheimera sp. KL1]